MMLFANTVHQFEVFLLLRLGSLMKIRNYSSKRVDPLIAFIYIKLIQCDIAYRTTYCPFEGLFVHSLLS